MAPHPLETDDLSALLGQFPNADLVAIRDLMARTKSFSPFPAARARQVHALSADADLRPHAAELAAEILWWGSHDIWSLFGTIPTWSEIVRQTAAALSVSLPVGLLAAWQIEAAILSKALADWEALAPDARRALLEKSGFVWTQTMPGAVAAAAAGMKVALPSILKFMAGRASPGLLVAAPGIATVGPVLALVATVAGGVWQALDALGPASRVVRPLTLTVAFARQTLRDEAAASAFGV